MTVMVLPPEDEEPWPTLGPEVCALMEASLVFGPGDLRGQPYVLDDEDRALVYAAYEVYPKGHPREGRRRFNTVVWMLRKGMKKSERAAAVAAVELHPEAPVRCDGFHKVDGVWRPVGRPVTDPYIPIVAYTEKQAEDTAWASLYVMVSEGPAADKFDIGLTRIMRAAGDGRAETLATAPDSRDGGRTTFQIKEEIHRWTLPRQHETHHTMSANLAKRPIAEPWELMPTTAYAPGQGSLAEKLHDAARFTLEQGDETAERSRMFFFYRWADESIDISIPEGLDEAIDEASGPIAARWSDRGRIADQFSAGGANTRYLERTWLNRIRKDALQAFDVERFKDLAEPSHAVLREALITLGFHGARYWDAAALVATEILTGFQWPIGIWQRPPDAPDWEVPPDEVDAAVATAFETYEVWKFYLNPDRWESSAAEWARDYGEDRVLMWRTNAWTHLVRAVRAWTEAMTTGELRHSGDEQLIAHVGAAHRRTLTGIRDDDGQPVWVPAKERPDSPFPINAALASIIGWQARLDAVKAGAMEPVTWRVA